MTVVDPTTIIRESSWHVGEWKDGCEVAPKCIKCPLPKCRFDETLQQQVSKTKAAIVRHLERETKLSRSSVCKIVKSHPSTVGYIMLKYINSTDEDLQEYFDCDFLINLVLDVKE